MEKKRTPKGVFLSAKIVRIHCITVRGQYGLTRLSTRLGESLLGASFIFPLFLVSFDCAYLVKLAGKVSWGFIWAIGGALS